jgi:DNA-binding response OmpR family regulator
MCCNVVDNGEQAVQVARLAGTEGQAPCPDLLILDLGLPRVDGIEVLRAFRANKNCTQTPVIVFTSSVSPQHRLVAEQFEGVRFVTKPLELEEFLEFGRTVKQMMVGASAR